MRPNDAAQLLTGRGELRVTGKPSRPAGPLQRLVRRLGDTLRSSLRLGGDSVPERLH